MFRLNLWSAVAAIGLLFLFGTPAALAENRVALVIGQSAYRAVTPLPNPANDAKAMAQLLGEAGFEVMTAPDLSQNALREKVSDFAAQVAAKGADTVALVLYAGHGMQIDGENFLVPVDIDPKREADIPLQAVRLNDVLNTLASVPSKMRIVLLDACRNNPFPAIGKTAGHGLAIVDAKFGAPGTFLSFSTSPGAEAEDGSGANSPYTTALLTAAKEPGLSIEDAFKRVRVSVNKATDGRQTPWESSSLTGDFRFFNVPGAAEAEVKPVATKRSADEWRRNLQGKSPEVAHEMIVADGSVDAYEAYVALYTEPPFAPQARRWLERHLRMLAWNKAVIENTAAGFQAFLVEYPDSDLTATARKLEERLRNRPVIVNTAVAIPGAAAAGSAATAVQPVSASSAAPTCPCNAPASPAKKAEKPSKKRVDTERPKRPTARPPRYVPVPDDDVVIYRRPSPPIYVPMPGPYIGGGVIGGRRGDYGPSSRDTGSAPGSYGRQRGGY
jgi:uncharacterized caspase-like protein